MNNEQKCKTIPNPYTYANSLVMILLYYHIFYCEKNTWIRHKITFKKAHWKNKCMNSMYRSIHQYILSAFSHFCFYTVTSFSPVSVFCFSHRWISKFFLLHFILETFIMQSNAPMKDTFISHSDPYFFSIKFSIKCQYIFCLSPDDYSIFLSLLRRKAR